jgi:beta-glucosidase
MIKIKAKYLLPLFVIAQIVAQKKDNNTELGFQKKAKELISKMTLQEKVDQMLYISPEIKRLNIPEYNWWNECLHGVARSGLATVFPQAIGMAAMWDKSKMFDISSIISDEARAKNNFYVSKNKRGIYQGLTMWTPNINIFRDPRWGRGMETYGEDPYLTGELAVNFVKGLQGNDPKYYKVIATAKHFVVHSGPEATRHSFNADPSDFDFLNTYSPQFEKVIKKSGVYSVMCAYNSFKGLPCCGNKTLSDLIRDKWGFKGYVVSDCWAVRDFYDKGAHEVVATKEEAAAMAVKAGTDLNCGNSYPALTEAVKKGLITEKELDVSLERLIVARLKLGLFAPKGAVKYDNIPISVLDSDKNKQSALEVARKSMVLLKNENNILPLSKNVKNVAVIGPNADDLEVLLGNYNGYPSNPITPLQGIINKLPNANVKYALGCNLAEALPVFEAVPASVIFQDKDLRSFGFKAEYFDNIDLSGTPKHVTVDKNVDFLWKTTSPFSDINYDKFSARWTGYISVPKSGKYALGGEAFSGMKLYVDDKLLTDRMDDHHPKKIYEYIELKANQPYKIKLEYVQNNTEYAIMKFLWDTPKENLEKQALDLAKNSDVVILCMGLSPLLEGEEMKVAVDGFSGGDRLDVKLPLTQTNLMKKLKELGKPMVLVLLNGSAVGINWENDNIPAILEAWYPGQAGGTAIADVIFGDTNPSGRLPVTFYKKIEDIPAFDNYSMEGKTYKYFDKEPLYEFGYGLSYSTFTYSNFKVIGKANTTGTLQVSVDVKNTSTKAGHEVSQLYLTHDKQLVKNTIRSLVGFQNTFFKAGETKNLKFTIDQKDLAQVNSDNKLEISPSTLSLSVGGSQPNENRIKDKKVATLKVKLEGKKVKF